MPFLRPSSVPDPRRGRSGRARAGVALAALLGATLGPIGAGPAPAADVDVDGDLFLGVWSPQRTRWLVDVPVCVRASGPGDAAAGAYRIAATGIVSDAAFAMANGIGDTIAYRVDWFGRGRTGQRERLSPGVESRRTYPFRSASDCAGGDAPGVRVRAARRTVDRAPPGIYRDTLLLTVSPI